MGTVCVCVCERVCAIMMQEGRGHWTVYYTSPHFKNNVFLFSGLTTLGTFLEFDGLVH